jgi:hypothetical protein
VRRVELDAVPRSRFGIGTGLLAAAGVLALVGSFLPWKVQARDLTPWRAFRLYGLWAGSAPVIANSYPVRLGFTAPVLFVAGAAFIACAIAVIVARRRGTAPVVVCVIGWTVWIAACLVLLVTAYFVLDLGSDPGYQLSDIPSGGWVLLLSCLFGIVGGLMAGLRTRDETRVRSTSF